MRITVYPNTTNFVMSDYNKLPLSAVDDDILQLSDAQRIKLTQIFLRQIPLCCLTQRSAKIVTAIFSQTIDFDKYEDDMNGRRLQQLTNLYPQHANEVVRYLEAIHVLITRKGRYGKYLSINFNFSQWGKEECVGIISNDPTIMLDKERFIAENSPEQLEKIEKARQNPANQSFEPIAPLPQQSTPHANTPPDYSQDLLKELLIAIRRIEENVNDLSKGKNTEKRLQRLIKKEVTKRTAHLIEKEVAKRTAHLIKKAPKPEEKQIKQQEAKTPVTKPTNEPVIEAETAKQTVEKSSASQHIATTPPSQISAKTPAKIPTENPTQTASPITLQFPSQLSQDQCYDIKKLLQRVKGDKTQMLLNMLSKRMQNTANPVKSPIAYLTNLITRLENDRLDMPLGVSHTTAHITPAKPQPLRQSERCRAEYQEAVADCIHMEQNIKLLAKKDSLTFAECLDKFDLRGLWESIRDRFTETKEALAEVQSLNGVMA